MYLSSASAGSILYTAQEKSLKVYFIYMLEEAFSLIQFNSSNSPTSQHNLNFFSQNFIRAVSFLFCFFCLFGCLVGWFGFVILGIFFPSKRMNNPMLDQKIHPHPPHLDVLFSSVCPALNMFTRSIK